MNVLVLGGGGHGKVVIDIVEQAGGLRLVGVLDARLPVGTRVLGCEVVGLDADLVALAENYAATGVLIAVGDNWTRGAIARGVAARAPGLAFPCAVHPSARLGKGVRLGRGTVVAAGAVVNPDTAVGEFGLLNTHCSVDHDCRLGDCVSFSPNACAGGEVTVGDYSAVGLGANVVHGITVGPQTVVGAGSTVLRDLPANVVAYGTPARVVRARSAGDRYL